MKYTYRSGTRADLKNLTALAINSWSPYKEQLSDEDFEVMLHNISQDNTFEELLKQSSCFVCESAEGKLIGMAYLVPSGNPTEIFLSDWCYIRYVSVDPDFAGQGIGRHLTMMCIEKAIENGEHTMALHTSEMMGNARHIYESMGFEIEREIEPKYGKRYWLYKLRVTNYELRVTN